ncbi:MAG: ATP-binding protein [Kofleriaceae bacterium]
MAVPEMADDVVDKTGVHSVIVLDSPTGRDAVRLSLVCVTGADLGRHFRVGFEPAIIGRGSVEIELSTTDVSRRHARISIGDQGFQIEDLGSANGTFLNGVRVTSATPLRVGDHVQIGNTVLVFAQRDELEERMQRVQRLEAMGQLAGGLAHDFNNTLSIIVANLDFIEESLPPDAADARDALASIRNAAMSGASLAKRITRLGTTDPLTFAVVPLTSLIEQIAALSRRQFGEMISISTNVEDDLAILGSYEELHQVLTNLLLNARDAMPGGGQIRVVARAIRCDAQQAIARDLPAAGDYVEICVADTGSGMDEATLARAFEPFFTTKPRGKGTGLGLAMIHGCVRRHGGAIEVESKLGSGTTFRLVFHRIAR